MRPALDGARVLVDQCVHKARLTTQGYKQALLGAPVGVSRDRCSSPGCAARHRSFRTAPSPTFELVFEYRLNGTFFPRKCTHLRAAASMRSPRSSKPSKAAAKDTETKHEPKPSWTAGSLSAESRRPKNTLNQSPSPSQRNANTTPSSATSRQPRRLPKHRPGPPLWNPRLPTQDLPRPKLPPPRRHTRTTTPSEPRINPNEKTKTPKQGEASAESSTPRDQLTRLFGFA